MSVDNQIHIRMICDYNTRTKSSYDNVIVSLCSFSVMAVFFKCMETDSFHSVT
jgi:hypothetical protein